MHLRWAVGELAIAIDTPSAGLDAAERALGLFATQTLELLERLDPVSDGLRDACYAAELSVGEVRATLRGAHKLRVERAQALHALRRKLHRALVIVAQALAQEGAGRSAAVSAYDHPELGSLLILRQMFSVFRGGMISAGEHRARLSWALEVAAAELSVMLAHPVLADLPLRSQQVVRELHGRLMAWGKKAPEPLLGRALYREATTIPDLGSELSSHPLLVDHDARGLAELAAIMANEAIGGMLETKALSLLSTLRGLDPELDKLELYLVYGAPGALDSLGLRVAELRSRVSRRSTRVAS